MIFLLYVYVAAALALLAGVTMIAKTYEKTFVSPAILLMAAFVAQSFITPISQYIHQYSTLDENNLGQVLRLSMQCFLALIAGYIVYVQKSHRQSVRALEPLVSKVGSRALIFFSLACFLAMVAYTLVASEGLTLARGAASYEGDSSLFGRLGVVSSLAITPLLLALFVAARTADVDSRLALSLTFYILLVGVLGVALLSFSRQQVVVTVLAVGLFYHYRVRQFGWRAVLGSVLLIMVVAAFARLRSVTASAVTLPMGELIGEFLSNFIDLLNPVTLILEVGGAIAGQEVFSQVLNIVPHYDGYKYGATYAQSAWGLLTPRIITGQYDVISTPAFWFREWYAPTVTSHGFDFSMLSEAYMNFGELMFLAFFPVGMLVAALSIGIRTTRSSALLVWLIFAWISALYGLRIDSNAFFKAMTYQFLPVLLIVFLDRTLLSRNRTRLATEPANLLSQGSVRSAPRNFK